MWTSRGSSNTWWKTQLPSYLLLKINWWYVYKAITELYYFLLVCVSTFPLWLPNQSWNQVVWISQLWFSFKSCLGYCSSFTHPYEFCNQPANCYLKAFLDFHFHWIFRPIWRKMTRYQLQWSILCVNSARLTSAQLINISWNVAVQLFFKCT